MAERRLGMGVIGCGGIAQAAHLPSIAQNPRARLIAVADIDLDRAKATAAQYGGQAYRDYHDLLANPDVEAVTVATPAALHAAPVIAAARAGKHILCEKPLATNIADADAMVAASDEAGVKLTIGYQTRFGTVWPLVKQIVADGLLGQVMGMHITGVGPSGHGAAWFLKKDLAGGGILMDWGIYTAFSILYWLGPVTRVYATTATFRTEVEVRGELLTDLDVEDTAAVHMTFASGAMGTWYSAWAVRARHSSTCIDGREGSLLIQSGTDGVGLFSTKLEDPPHLRGWHQIPATEPPLGTLHYRKIANLVDAVLDGAPLAMTGADGRAAVELVLASYRSAETGQPVDLPLAREAAGAVAVAAS